MRRVARGAVVGLLLLGVLVAVVPPERPATAAPPPPAAITTGVAEHEPVECPPGVVGTESRGAGDAVISADQPPSFEGPTNGPRVVVLGDSITAAAEADIRARLQTTYRTSVFAVCGYTSAQIAGNAFLYAPTAADIVIVNAGTNDAPTIDLGATFDHIDAIRAHFTGEAFVVASLNQHTYSPTLNSFAERFNFFLAFSGKYPHILDFNRYVELHPDQFSDTVHPDLGAGTQGYAALVRDAADRALRAITPIGSLDEVTVGAGTVTAKGWAIDPDTTGSIKVHVYVDGVFRGEYTANQNRPDVGAAYPAYGSAHGYSVTLSVSGGSRNVCVYAINAGAGSANPLLGCRRVEVGRPFGSVDSAIAVPVGLRVRGWAIDPDTVNPIKVHVYVDSQFRGEYLANELRPDIGSAYPSFGAAHGYDVGILAPPGRRRVDVYAINVGGGSSPHLGTRFVDVLGGNPIGSFDWTRSGPGQITLAGWAIDPDDPQPAKVHVYVDGQFRGEFVADRSRPDVARVYPGYGPNRGFELTVPAAAGRRTVCVYAINTYFGTTNPTLGCRTVQIGGNPIGAVEAATGLTGSVRVRGWALDPDTAGPVQVHVYVGGAFAGVGTADVARAEIGAFFPDYGPNHGFDVTVPAPAGVRTVAVYAINVGAGTTNPYLGARTVTIT